MKRNDARLCYDIPLYNQIFPFLMKKRNESIVYHTMTLDLTETAKYIRAYNATKPEFRLKFFYVFCAAVMRVFALRPELNRFIASNHYWQRNELSLNFVVKENFTDDAPETSNPLVFKPEMTLFEYAKIMDDYINGARHVSKDYENYTDDTIGLFMHFPSWVVSLAVKFLGFLDRHGRCPKFVRDADGLHTSVFIANLGSIGIEGGSPHHHLYEWGTTSMFITLGRMDRTRDFDDNGKVIATRETMQIGFSVDERVTSGFYFIKSMLMLQDLLNHPAELEKVPDLPQDTPTKAQYKAKMKELKKQKKLAKKEAKKASEQSHS